MQLSNPQRFQDEYTIPLLQDRARRLGKGRRHRSALCTPLREKHMQHLPGLYTTVQIKNGKHAFIILQMLRSGREMKWLRTQHTISRLVHANQSCGTPICYQGLCFLCISDSAEVYVLNDETAKLLLLCLRRSPSPSTSQPVQSGNSGAPFPLLQVHSLAADASLTMNMSERMPPVKPAMIGMVTA